MLREKRDDKDPRNMACYHDPLMVRFLLELAGTGDGTTAEDIGQVAVKVSWPAAERCHRFKEISGASRAGYGKSQRDAHMYAWK